MGSGIGKVYDVSAGTSQKIGDMGSLGLSTSRGRLVPYPPSSSQSVIAFGTSPNDDVIICNQAHLSWRLCSSPETTEEIRSPKLLPQLRMAAHSIGSFPRAARSSPRRSTVDYTPRRATADPKCFSTSTREEMGYSSGTSPFLGPATNTSVSTPVRGGRRMYLGEEVELPLGEEDPLGLDDFALASSTHTARMARSTHEVPTDLGLGSPASVPGEEVLEFVSFRRPGLQECTQCRRGLPYGANFCPQCGTPTALQPLISIRDVSRQQSLSLASSEHCTPQTSPTLSVSSTRQNVPGGVSSRKTMYRRRVKISTRRQVGQLGRGSHGTVYKAMDIMSGQQLAVKELYVNPLDESEVTSIRSELRHLSNLRHPNIVEYYGCSIDRTYGNADSEGDEMIQLIVEDESKPMLCVRILMERMECGTLEQLMKSFPDGLPESTVSSYAAQLLEAIIYVHTCGVTHRDIKPSNVLLASDGTIKISDFGCALVPASSNMAVAESSDKRRVAGTPAYMPPEALACVSDPHLDWLRYGQAQDIWALGCVVHHLLTGNVPWSHVQSSNPFALLMHISKQDQFPISESLSAEAADFVECCLQIDPSERLYKVSGLRIHPFITQD